MFVLTVTPLKKGFGLESLSYFSANSVEPGSVISVPLRKGSVEALVVESELAEKFRAELRSADYSLRKIGEVKSKPFLSPEWMNAAKKIAEYFAAPLGSAVAALIPSFVLENIPKVAPRKFLGAGKFDFAVFQGNDEERISHYKSIIRGEFARKKSVFLCVPNVEEVEKAKEIFSKGIEKYILAWTANMGKKKFAEQWKELQKEEHPLLIIGTPQWLFLPMSDIGTIILDREQRGSWKGQRRPFIDTKKFAEQFAKEVGAQFIAGDLVLTSETIHSYKEYDPYKFESLNFRANSSAKSLLINPEKSFISPQLFNLVLEAKENAKNIFIYATRKGLSSVTVCRDCGADVLCENCGVPVVLYKGTKVNVFRCHQCGEMRSAEERCKTCTSWRLLPLGVGAERVAEELRRMIPGVALFEVNSEITTPAQARKVIKEFHETLGGVLVGTEMAVDMITQPVDYAAIASIDSLFAIPDYHIREKIFRLIVEIKAKANEKFLVQLRNTEKETVEMALGGNILEFYKREIKEREEMQYPPFSVFIKITLRGNKPMVKNEMVKLGKLLKPYSPAIFPSTSEKQGQPYAENAVMKIKRDMWPDQNLLNILKTVPPFFEIKVDPDNLL